MSNDTGITAYTAPRREIHAWVLGGIATHALICTYGQAMNIFTVGFGLNAAVVGWAMMLPRVVDALIDPFMGHFSDNTRTRWGRRKPFLVLGAALASLFVFLLWWGDSGWSHRAQLIYLTVIGTLFYTSWGLYSMAWTALGYELTDDYNERSRVAALAGVITAVVLLANSWVYWFALRPLFEVGVGETLQRLFAKGLDWAHMRGVLGASFATVPGGPANEINGIRWITTLVVILAMSAAIYAARNCKERFSRANTEHPPIGAALKATFQNRPFMILMLFKLFQVFGERVFQGLLFFIGVYYVCQGDKNLATKITGQAGIFGSLVGFTVLPFIKPISQKLGKRMGLVIPAAIALLLMVAQPLILTPEHPYLLLIPLLMLAPLSIVTNAMISAIVPDICDLDELENGTRREGLFTSVVAFMGKLEISLSVLIVGYLVNFSGIDQKTLIQPEASLQKLLWLAIGPAVVFTLLALLTSLKFRMNEAFMLDVREKLDARRLASS